MDEWVNGMYELMEGWMNEWCRDFVVGACGAVTNPWNNWKMEWAKPGAGGQTGLTFGIRAFHVFHPGKAFFIAGRLTLCERRSRSRSTGVSQACRCGMPSSVNNHAQGKATMKRKEEKNKKPRDGRDTTPQKQKGKR